MVQTCPYASPAPMAINLANPSFFADGHAHQAWRWLRAEAPVSWNDGTDMFPGFWSITKYADVLRISRDTATFVSGRGFTMTTDPDNPSPAAGLGTMLIAMDPPRHVRLRRLVNKGFTPRMVAALEPRIRAIATGVLDRAKASGAGDFVPDVAAALPLAVICSLVGVPEEDWEMIHILTNQVLGADDAEYQTTEGDRAATSAQGTRAMFGYFARLVADRRRRQQDDLVSLLTSAALDGEALVDEEILYFCFLLILAGNETTRQAITGGMLALIEHPDQRARLLTAPELLATGVEEVLRWTSPVLHMMRTATRDTEIRGKAIRAGERVVMWYPSANRDEAIFPDPDRFDVSRTPNEHLALGHGEHFCLGAGLARLELRVMFEEILQRLPSIQLAGRPAPLRSTLINGIKHMPVRYGE